MRAKRALVVAVLALGLAGRASAAKKKRTYHGVDHPHDGHEHNEGEFYPGYKHYETNPYMAPAHSHHSLLTAAMACDQDKVRGLLREGVPVDFRHHEHADSALLYASRNHSYANQGERAAANGGLGSLPCVRLLLKAGANVELTDHEGKTALMAAAQHASLSIIEALLAAGAHAGREVSGGPDAGKKAADLARRSQCEVCAEMIEAAEQHEHELHPPERKQGLEARRREAEARLGASMRSFDWWQPAHWWARAVGGYPSGDECELHRALDLARATAKVDGGLVERGQALRSALAEEVMDVLEQRHVCEEVAPYLLSHGLYTLRELHRLSLPLLQHRTQLDGFETHMLQRAVKNHMARFSRDERSAKRKEEVRRLHEEEEAFGGKGSFAEMARVELGSAR